MGLLINGKWEDTWYDTKSTGGNFVRTQTQFRNWITSDGSAGPTGVGGFIAEKDRYHLYVSLACPWASRTLIMRELKGLTEYITVSVVNPYMLENGWTFEEYEGVVSDPVYNAKYLYEIYVKEDSSYTGRVTVPILFDKKKNKIVSNESADIVRMFNSAFNHLTGNDDDYYPKNMKEEIDSMNDFLYNSINNGVYKVGFTTNQKIYEQEVTKLFESLDEIEDRLATKKYLFGNRLTESDIRLFTTLVRFDVVYYGHFKCNIRQLRDYPNLWRYTKEIYNEPLINKTVNFDHIKNHYYGSHLTINPTRIVPKGPEIDWTI